MVEWAGGAGSVEPQPSVSLGTGMETSVWQCQLILFDK